MATFNPFSDDPERAEIWELGYVGGFQDPAGSDFLPLSPELLDVYTQGIDAGRDDNLSSARAWVPRPELEGESSDEWKEHLIIEVIAESLAHLFKSAAFGLAGVLISVLSIPGDTPLHPLEDDFSETYAGPDDDTHVTFTALCPRTDHPAVAADTTPEGYWTGSPRTDFGDALQETVAHAHRESVVARCSLTDNTCGLVWAAR